MLYDGLKNFLLVPVLLFLRKFDLPPGRIAALFVFLYAGLRIPIDLLREYPISMWGLPTGQTLNIIMVSLGILLLAMNIARGNVGSLPAVRAIPETFGAGLRIRQIVLIVLCVIPLVIPSDATRDVPATYGKRHAGLEYSWMYQPIADDLANSANPVSKH